MSTFKKHNRNYNLYKLLWNELRRLRKKKPRRRFFYCEDIRNQAEEFLLPYYRIYYKRDIHYDETKNYRRLFLEDSP